FLIDVINRNHVRQLFDRIGVRDAGMYHQMSWSCTLLAAHEGRWSRLKYYLFSINAVYHYSIDSYVRSINIPSILRRNHGMHIRFVLPLRMHTAALVLHYRWVRCQTSVIINLVSGKIASSVVGHIKHTSGRIYAYMAGALAHG